MPQGKCEKCGEEYKGWALLHEEHLTCDKCGGRIIVEGAKINE